MRGWWTRALAVAAVAGLSVTACGDDNGETTTENGSGATPEVALPGSVNDHGTTELGSGTSLELALDDQYFEPTFVQAAPDGTVSVTVRNSGSLPHTFTIDGAGIDEQVGPGEEATAEVTLPSSGIVHFYCRFHVAGGMQGAFVVEGSGSAATTTAPPTEGGGGDSGGIPGY